MSALEVFSALGDIMGTLGVFSTPGDYHEYTGGISRCMLGIIMSTLGVFSTLEGYHEYTGGLLSVHQGVFSTPE